MVSSGKVGGLCALDSVIVNNVLMHELMVTDNKFVSKFNYKPF